MMSKRPIFFIFVIILIGLLIKPQVESQSIPDGTTIERAKQLWEMAIVAKGGRERLHQVKNVVISDKKMTDVDFAVFPDLYFSWLDSNPSKLGLLVEMFNFERDNGYVLLGGQLHANKTLDPNLRSRFRTTQLYFFLETKWFKPEILRSSKSTIGTRRVDLVEIKTKEAGDPFRCGVFLDEKTHLPVRIGFYPDDHNSKMFSWVDLDEYQEISGIKVPTAISSENGKWNKLIVEINVDYDSTFFEQMPDMKAGPYQWRKSVASKVAPQVATTGTTKMLKPEQIAQYLKDLESSDGQTVMFARRELVNAGDQAVPALTEALKSKSSKLRLFAASILLGINKESDTAVATMQRFLLDPQETPQNRQQAAFQLMAGNKGIIILTELLEHSDVLVRRCVIFAFDELTELAEIPKLIQNAIPKLKNLLKDSDEVVRGMAEEILGQINGKHLR